MYDQIISKNVRRANELESAKHEPSGKLSAGFLGKPLLEQVLKVIGVPQKSFDDYALRLFARGKQAEAFVISMLDDVKDSDIDVEYRDTVGKIDVRLKNNRPIEVKSVKNSKFKRIEKQKKPDVSHDLQGALYALATQEPTYDVLYVAADDLRTLTFERSTEALKPFVDGIIDEVQSQLKRGTLPEFSPRETWQSNSMYSSYPDWLVLTPEEAMKKLEREFPDSYKKLKGAK